MSGALWVFSPLYHDVESYLRLREELRGVLAGEAPPLGPARFVVIDDSAGTDRELERLAALPDVTVLRPPFNLGHQRALVYGLRTLQARIGEDDLVLTLDADGEDRPQDVPALLRIVAAEPGNPRVVALARRTSRRVTLGFRLMYLCFALLFRLLTGTLVKTGNFAAFRGWAVKHVLFHPHFDLVYSASLLSLDLDVRLVPCPRGLRYAGRSHMGPFRLIRHGIAMLMPFLDRIAVRYLILFSGLLGLGLGSALLTALAALAAGRALPQGFTTLVLLTLVLGAAALGNLLILFAVYAQSQGAALSALERGSAGREPEA